MLYKKQDVMLQNSSDGIYIMYNLISKSEHQHFDCRKHVLRTQNNVLLNTKNYVDLKFKQSFSFALKRILDLSSLQFLLMTCVLQVQFC